MSVLTQYFFGIASWSVELALWGLVFVLFPLLLMKCFRRTRLAESVNETMVIFIMIGAVMVEVSYLYFLINNLKILWIVIGLAVVFFSVYSNLAERLRKSFH